VLIVLFGSFLLRGANEGAENEAELFGQKKTFEPEIATFSNKDIYWEIQVFFFTFDL